MVWFGFLMTRSRTWHLLPSPEERKFILGSDKESLALLVFIFVEEEGLAACSLWILLSVLGFLSTS